MLRATRWSLGLASVVVAGLLSAGAHSLSAQDAGKAPGARGAAGGQERENPRRARMAKLREAVTAAKTTLPAAIATVEQSTKGKAFSAEYAVPRDGKFSILVRVFVGERMGEVAVDPETGKAGEMKTFEESPREGRPARGEARRDDKGDDKDGEKDDGGDR
jgi:hypothetical protein